MDITPFKRAKVYVRPIRTQCSGVQFTCKGIGASRRDTSGSLSKSKKTMSQPIKKAVIYTRVSTTEQADEGNSLVTQERICREHAERHGYTVVQVFVERGESAKTANRTELQKLLAFCSLKKNGINAIIIYKIDRLSRNTDDYSQLRLILKRYSVEIKSATEPIGNNAMGRFMENTMANMAQFDNDVRTERCTNGMLEAISEGRYVWGAPVGYSNGASLNGKPTIAPNEMAPLVRQAFELVAGGLYSAEEVRKLMQRNGLVTKSGKPLSRSYFYDMLRNSIYTARIEKFGERHQGLFDAIVSEELYMRTQRALARRGHKVAQYKKDHPDFPLRRFVFSPEGLKLTGSRAKGRYDYYRFGMKGSNYAKRDLESKFTELMDSYRLSDKHVAKLKTLIKEKFRKATETTRAEENKMRARLNELDATQSALIQKNIKGFISDGLMQKQLATLESESNDIQATLTALRNESASPEEALSYAEEYLTAPSSLWSKADISIKTKLQWFQFPQGVTFDGEKFGTREVASVFNTKEAISASLSSDVDPIGFEPMTSSLQMRRSTN